VRPDTIVTFGPDGMTGHPDHRAVSAWTTAAWMRGGRSARLWYATLTPAFHATWGELNARLGLWSYTEAPPCTPDDELAHEEVLTGPALERKVAALRAHASQTEALERLVGTPDFRRWWSTESFVDASTVLADAGQLELERGAA
jgi:LmbE family N-acetylglucosaminyl deacetylase